MIWGWVPGKVSPKAVLRVYDTFARRKPFEDLGIGSNGASFAKSLPKGLPYIEDQRRRVDEPFGKVTVSYAACEVIAVYNALLYLYGREMVPFGRLLRYFERHGAVFGARWGTSPLALRRFFVEQGIADKAKMGFSCRTDAFDGMMGEKSTRIAGILSFFNDRSDIRKGVHTICVTAEREGLVSHNLSEDGRMRGPFLNISGILGDRRGGLCLITLNACDALRG